MSKHVFRKKRLGFNAIELVVVVLFVAILGGMVLVYLRSLRVERGRGGTRTQTNNDLKSLALACHSHNDAYKRLPPAFDQFAGMAFPASIHVHLLPFVEQANLHRTILATGGQQGSNEVVSAFNSPMDFTQTRGSAGVQNFAANLRVFSDKGVKTPFDENMVFLGAIEPGTAAIPRTFEDGTSNTIVFATKFGLCGNGGSRYAASPISPFAAYFGQNAAQVPAHRSARDATFQLKPSICHTSPLMAQSFSDNGISVALADGSVRFVRSDISPRTWNLAVQPNDGLELGNDW